MRDKKVIATIDLDGEGRGEIYIDKMHQQEDYYTYHVMVRLPDGKWECPCYHADSYEEAMENIEAMWGIPSWDLQWEVER